jgi:hypothetical protein
MSLIIAYFPKTEKRVYNINSIYDFTTGNLKWTSQKGENLTGDVFNNLLKSSILELKLADGQQIPTDKLRTEFEHFYIDNTSDMFSNIRHYEIVYNTETNSAIFTIMPKTVHANATYRIKDIINSRGGRPRHRSIFRQRRLKRTDAKSRRATHRHRRV